MVNLGFNIARRSARKSDSSTATNESSSSSYAAAEISEPGGLDASAQNGASEVTSSRDSSRDVVGDEDTLEDGRGDARKLGLLAGEVDGLVEGLRRSFPQRFREFRGHAIGLTLLATIVAVCLWAGYSWGHRSTASTGQGYVNPAIDRSLEKARWQIGGPPPGPGDPGAMLEDPAKVPGATAKPPPREAFISWSSTTGKCVDVKGGYNSNGNVLHIWPCRNFQDMKFLMPAAGSGFIKWAKHPSLCLDAPGGKDLQLWDCKTGNQTNMLFTLPQSDRGQIRVAARPSTCIEVQERIPDHGRWLQIWDCTDKTHQENMEFDILESIDCQWTQWSTWTSCSKGCHEWGTRTRSRTIATQAHAGKVCEGSTSELIGCQGYCEEEAKDLPESAESRLMESPTALAETNYSYIELRRGSKQRGSAWTACPLATVFLVTTLALLLH